MHNHDAANGTVEAMPHQGRPAVASAPAVAATGSLRERCDLIKAVRGAGELNRHQDGVPR
jgi:hypothetical protein